MPASAAIDKHEYLKLTMAVFMLDGLIDNMETQVSRCLNLALTKTGFEKFIDAVDPHSAICPKTALQKLAAGTAFPRVKIELVLKEFNAVFTQQALPALKLKNATEVTGTIGALKSQGLTVVAGSYQCFGVAMTLINHLHLVGCFDLLLGADNVHRPPPSPEMAYKFCLHDGLSPRQIMVLDELAPGQASAQRAGCHVYTKPVTVHTVADFVKEKNDMQRLDPIVTSWQQKTTLLFHLDQFPDPFEHGGYGYPTPLVDIHGVSFCQAVLKNLNLASVKLIFVVRKSHYERYNMKFFLESLGGKKEKDMTIVTHENEGDASKFRMQQALMLAKEHIPVDQPLLVVSCSQLVEWDSNSFLYYMANPCVTAGLLTFNSAHPRHGFVATDDNGWVSKCVLNTPISSNATTGVYYWKSGSVFLKYTQQAIDAGLDGPSKLACLHAFQKAIEDGQKVRQYECPRVWEMSSRRDLDHFLQMSRT